MASSSMQRPPKRRITSATPKAKFCLFPGVCLNFELEPSAAVLIQHAQHIGLRLYQDITDRSRMMFDATCFNRLGGYTATKGIKGDFLARLKRKIEESNQLCSLSIGGSEQGSDRDDDDDAGDDVDISSDEDVAFTERDNWESNCFAEIIASGDSIRDLVDARVGSARLVGDVAKNTITSGARCLYLLHISVLGAWVDSKYTHAEELLTKFLQDQQTCAPATDAPSSDQVAAAQAPVSLFKKVLSHLQIKQKDVLVFVLGVGQRMNHAQQADVLAAAASQQLNTEASSPPPSLFPGNRTEEIRSITANLALAEIPNEFQAWFNKHMSLRQQNCSALSERSRAVQGSKRAIPTAVKLWPLLKSVCDVAEPPDRITVQQMLSASEQLTLELRAWCSRMDHSHNPEPVPHSSFVTVPAPLGGKDRTSVLVPVVFAQNSPQPAVSDSAAATPLTQAKAKRRIQPTLC